jgi:hypothetical protein
MIPLDQHHLLRHVFPLFLGTETNNVADARVGLLASMSDTHAATDADVEAAQLSLLIDHSNETEVIGKNIDIIVGRYCDSDFELIGFVRQGTTKKRAPHLARQIKLSV